MMNNYLAHKQLLSPGSVTGGASSVIKWNPTPKMINAMTTPVKGQICYNNISLYLIQLVPPNICWVYSLCSVVTI